MANERKPNTSRTKIIRIEHYFLWEEMEEFEHPDVDVPANISLAHQSLFKAEKMTEPLKPPASAAAYYFMTHHSELDNLTPAEIDVLWGKVPKKQKKKCIEEHKKKRKDYVVYEIEKFVRALSPAELKSFHTITKNRARDQEDEVKESSDEESSSSNEEQTSGACWDDEESEEELSNSNEGQTSVACWDDEASETSKKTVKREEDVDSDEDLEIPPKTTFQKPNSSLEMYCNSYMDKYSKHPKLTKQDLKSTLATNQSLFKAEKMTEPLQIPSSATAYYVMTHHSKLDNLTPAEIDVLWGKVSDKQKKTCIEEHKKKRKDYVYEFEKFLRALSPAELKSFHTITKNRARDQEDEVKESSDEESSSSNEEQTSGTCWDDEESEEESSNSNESQTSVACWDDEASETSKKTVKREEDVDSDEDLEIPPKTTFQKPNSSLEMYCNSYMDKYSKHPKLTKQDLKSTLATNQSLFKAEKMTEPLQIPSSAAAYYVMTHHSELGNLTPAEIDVLWGKVPKKQKKKCIEEHKKKRKDYVVYEIEKFVRALSPAELRSYHTITKNLSRDQEDDVKESSDDEFESISTDEDQTSVACSDHDGQNILGQD